MQRKQPKRRSATATQSRIRTTFLKSQWPKLVLLGISVATFASLYLLLLNTLLPAGPTERHTIADSLSFGSLMHDPLLLAYKLPAFLLHWLPGSDILHVRLTAAIIAGLTIGLFYYIARRWYGRTNGLWLTWLFAVSSWMLQSGRFGSPVVALSLCVVALVAAGVWLRSDQAPNWALVGFGAALANCLLTPGGIWLAIVAVVLLYPDLADRRSSAKPLHQALAGGLVGLAVIIVAVAIVRSPQLALQWAGIPSPLPDGAVIAKQAIGNISYLVARGPHWPEVWLAHTPVLDVASSALLLLGAWFYAGHLGNIRSRLLLATMAIGAIMVALNGAFALSLLIPTIYLVAGGGMAYLMHQWHQVFPRNPLARGSALGLMVILLACIAAFHLNRSFIAWRLNPSTQAVYHLPAESQPPNLLQ